MTKKLGKTIHHLNHIKQYETLLVAIASQQNGYKLCWALNNCFNIGLADAEDFRIEHETNSHFFPEVEETLSFPSYFYEDTETNITYRLVYNKHVDGYLIKSLKNVDFLLVVNAPRDFIDTSKLVLEIKKTELALMVFYIETEKLKNKERKILEF